MQFCGELKEDAAWSGAVALTGDVVIPRGRTLRLAPGATLSFSPKPRWSCSVFRAAPQGYPIEATCRQECDIVVLGRLEAAGARLAAPDGARWGGVTLLESGRADLRECELAGVREHAVQCFDDGDVRLERCSISRARVGVLAWGLSRVAGDGVEIADCEAGLLCREGSRARWSGGGFSRVAHGVWGQQWALIDAARCRFEDCAEFRAGAYERSRVSLDGRTLAESEPLR